VTGSHIEQTIERVHQKLLKVQARLQEIQGGAPRPQPSGSWDGPRDLRWIRWMLILSFSWTGLPIQKFFDQLERELPGLWHSPEAAEPQGVWTFGRRARR
jgi:hypothetical protein